MKNKRNVIMIMLFVYSIYVISTLFNSDFMGNILSPIVAFIAFMMLMNCVLSPSTSVIGKIIWLCFSLACLSWAAADVVWGIYDLVLDSNPEDSLLILYLYPFANIFLVIGSCIYSFLNFKKWNGIQLFVDTLATAIVCIILFWIVYLHKSNAMPELITKDGWISVFCIILDIVAFIGIAIWYISIRKGNIMLPLRLVSGGLLAYILVDLYYYYIYFYDQYVANSFIDALYMGSFVCIAIGGFLGRGLIISHPSKDKVLDYSNVGLRKKSLLFFFAPIILYQVEGFVLVDQLSILLIILAHESLSFYVHGSVHNEILLIKEKEMNHILEEKIAERTKKIVEKSLELEQKNKQLKFISNQDTVTSLYNRRYFIRKLKDSLKNIVLEETVALLFIDVDRFKTINDTYGHQIGDELLIQLSKRLNKNNYEKSILARLGGDEFVIGLQGRFDYQQIEVIANELILKCSEPIEIQQYVFHVGISIGISIFPLDATDWNTLMKNADIAMYQAKMLGRGRCVSFDHVFTNLLQRKNEIEILLRKADFNKEFELFYQPQFSIPSNQLIGVEALLRWKNPLTGYISPSEFIPIAEEVDYINPIGEWVLKQSIYQVKQWNSSFFPALKIGINVSPKQLDNKNFIQLLKDTITSNDVRSENIDIEITESIAIEGEYRIQQIDSLFKGLGVSVSIDDFGTGYSSLAYLKFFPFERIKIAKPLIDSIATINYDLQIVKAIIMLAKSIGIQTIAEGVETQEQYKILVELGCDEIQGFYLAKPMPATEFEERYLKTYK